MQPEHDSALLSARSLLLLINEAVDTSQEVARQNGVTIGVSVDPSLPPYVSVRRVDLPSLVTVLIRRALSIVRNTQLYLTIGESSVGRIVVQLEDAGELTYPLAQKHWEQLVFWIEELGGEITRDQGPLLWNVVLPLDAQSSSTIVPRGEGSRILVACSDTDVRGRIVQFSQAHRHSLVECRSHDRALALCASHRFDLVLLDSDLAGGGLSLARTLHGTAPGRCLVALLSSEIPTDAKDFSWVHFWMHKPPRESELRLALQAAKNHRQT